MQVDAFGGHVGAEQHAQFGFGLAELFHDALLLHVAHAAVEDLHGAGLEFHIVGKLVVEPLEGFDAFAEDHQAIFAVSFLPAEVAAFEQLEQGLVFIKGGRGDVTQGQRQGLEALDFPSFVFGDLVLLFQLGNALLHGHVCGGRGAENSFLQADADQLTVLCLAVFAR